MQERSEQQSSARNPRILIIGFHSSRNAGDLALLQMNMCQLRSAFLSPVFLISANYPDDEVLHHMPDVHVVPSAFSIVGANHSVPVPRQIFLLLIGVLKVIFYRGSQQGAKAPWKQVGWAGLLGAVWQADLVVSVSGNIFLSMGKWGWPFPLSAFPVWATHRFHKPFYVMPQSIGPFHRRWEKAIFRQLYGRARRVFLRDQVSMELAKELSLPSEKVHFAPDPAFALPMADREEALEILKKYGYRDGQAAVGITVIAPISRVLSDQVIEQYYRDLATALDHFIQDSHVRVYIFNQVTGPTLKEDDRMAGRRILSLFPPDQSHLVLVDAVLTPAQLKTCYACMDLMIASRLHSGIFAMGAGVATLSIGYFTKSRGLMRAMGLENWLLELGKADAEKIGQKISEAWEQRVTLANAVKEKASAYAEEVMRLSAQIRADFDRIHMHPRIVQLVKGLDIGEVNGGSDVFGHNLARALKEAGADARLVVFYQMNSPAERQFIDQLVASGVEVIFLQPWRGHTSLSSYWQGFKKLSSYIKNEKINVLHSHFHIGTLMAAWLRLFGVVPRVARTAHVDREWKRGWDGLLKQALIRSFIFVFFPLLIDLEGGVSQESVSVLNTRWLPRLLGKKAVLVHNAIPSPAPTTLEQIVQSAGKQKQSGAFIIGTVGRMTEQKGHIYLLEAIPDILHVVPDARFLWIGDGPLRSVLEEKAAQLGVRSSIEFTGTRIDVPALLDSMDLFVLPSIYEGLPTVVVESMAHGVPVIGTDIPGTREIIQHQHNGWLAAPYSSKSLAEAIIHAVLQSDERIRIAKQAARSLHEFTMERAAEKYLNFYQRFLS